MAFHLIICFTISILNVFYTIVTANKKIIVIIIIIIIIVINIMVRYFYPYLCRYTLNYEVFFLCRFITLTSCCAKVV